MSDDQDEAEDASVDERFAAFLKACSTLEKDVVEFHKRLDAFDATVATTNELLSQFFEMVPTLMAKLEPLMSMFQKRSGGGSTKKAKATANPASDDAVEAEVCDDEPDWLGAGMHVFEQFMKGRKRRR